LVAVYCAHCVTVLPRLQSEPEEDPEKIGGSINEAKNAALLGATCELPSDSPVTRGAIYDRDGLGHRDGGTTGNLVGHGVVSVGIPVGDPACVRRLLELKQEVRGSLRED
jgi:hypothetical protein